jgi:hypothetical protein
MAVRAHRDLDNAVTKTYKLNSAAITVGDIVSLVTDDEHVTPTTADGTDAIGVALNDQATANGDVHVVLLTSAAVAAVKLGGTATRGSFCKVDTTDGLGGNLTPAAGGATYVGVVGQFLQSGVVGDLVGVQLGGFLAIET